MTLIAIGSPPRVQWRRHQAAEMEKRLRAQNGGIAGRFHSQDSSNESLDLLESATWGVDNGLLGSERPPPLTFDPFVGGKREAKAITTPLEVAPIVALVDTRPDRRWRLALQRLSADGLRPEEPQPLQIGGEQKPGWGVTDTASVRVTDRGQAHESANKEAATDAMNRALKTFGNPFGLALYDNQQREVRWVDPHREVFSAEPRREHLSCSAPKLKLGIRQLLPRITQWPSHASATIPP